MSGSSNFQHQAEHQEMLSDPRDRQQASFEDDASRAKFDKKLEGSRAGPIERLKRWFRARC